LMAATLVSSWLRRDSSARSTCSAASYTLVGNCSAALTCVSPDTFCSFDRR
jgi:hypothetical protein